VDGVRIQENSNGLSDTAFFIVLTGLFLSIPSFLYSGTLRSTGSSTYEQQKLFASMLNYFLLFLFVPFAHYFNSVMLGYFSVIAFYGILGFSVACYGLCYLIGFDSDEAMGRVACTSTILMIIFSALKIMGIKNSWIYPFSSAIMTFGAITLFLALLIMSSKYYYRRSIGYGKAQLLFITVLMISTFVGFVFHIEPIKNVALTFGVLFFMEKTAESAKWSGGTIMVLFLFFSVALYFISYFLSSHPNFIISMFSAI